MFVVPAAARLGLLRNQSRLGRKQQRGLFFGLSPSNLRRIYDTRGLAGLRSLLLWKITIIIPTAGIVAWMFWIPYNRDRMPTNRQLHHAWLAVEAAHATDPSEYVNRESIRATHDFQSVAVVDMLQGQMRLALLETPDAMYLGIRGPTQGSPQLLTKTDPIDESDDLPRDLIHTGALRFVEAVPFYRIWDDSNWLDRHLIVSGHGMGGVIAQLLVLQELYQKRISAFHHRVRAIAFGAPFCNHKKNRDDVMKENWRNMFLNVVNQNDPWPAILSSLLSPGLRDTKLASPIEELLKRADDVYGKFWEESDAKRQESKAAKGESKVSQLWDKIRKQLPSESEWSHFDPIGLWMFMEPAGGLPLSEDSFSKHLPDSQHVIWKRKDLRQIFQQRQSRVDAASFASGRLSAYASSIKKLCYDPEAEPQANRSLPVIDVEFPVYIHPKLL
eukprot:NODE_1037_length_1746_cov_31.776075_g915_i0.p1 GENE.NODE_1037_length_1746_cov_31.776075_g915_i0~~NODE_1037_length_1746_cov_31.776075_g915_i0.p1  ORF type:complete len:444 (-),score=75.97 NODE_1037_length_1746_cov_31.776075_g915_i0:297-1628(-)